jgi:hypothetical protein
MPNTGGWKDRHNLAITLGGFNGHSRPFETAVAQMITGWARYAQDHKKEYESAIGDDGVIGKAWLEAGKAFIDLLNGNTGRLDCGTLDAFLRDTMHENGFTEADTD